MSNAMKKIVINGISYPLNFSVHAIEQIGERFEGGISNLDKELTSLPPEKQLSEVIWLIYIGIEQGCEYVNLFGGGDKIEPIPLKALKVWYNVGNLQDLLLVLTEAINGSMSTTVELEEEEPKNEKATQGE